MAFFNFPFHIAKDTPAIANQVQTNFDDLLTWVLDNVVQKDGTVAMTGPLVLAPGAPGSPDHAANKAYVDSQIPVGVIWEYGGTVLPAHWLWCNGATYTITSQQKLYDSIQRSFTLAAVPVGSFSVPDKRKKFSVGADASEAAVFGLGKTGGQRNSELQKHLHSVPAHGHADTISAVAGNDSPDHTHTAGTLATVAAGQHGHNFGNNSLIAYHNPNGWATVPGGGGTGLDLTTFVHDGSHTHTFTGNTAGASARHTHTVTINGAVTDKPAFNTVETGAGTTLVDKNLPPYLAVNYIIYAGPA